MYVHCTVYSVHLELLIFFLILEEEIIKNKQTQSEEKKQVILFLYCQKKKHKTITMQISGNFQYFWLYGIY